MVFKFYPSFNEDSILMSEKIDIVDRISGGRLQQMRRRQSDDDEDGGGGGDGGIDVDVKNAINMSVHIISNDDDEVENEAAMLLTSLKQQQCSPRDGDDGSTSTSMTTSAYFSCSDTTAAGNVVCCSGGGGGGESSKLDEVYDDYDDDGVVDGLRYHIHRRHFKIDESVDDLDDRFDSCSLIIDSVDTLDIFTQGENKSDQNQSFKLDLFKSLCAQIDTKYTNTRTEPTTNCDDLKLNCTFWSYVLHKLGLMDLLNCSSGAWVVEEEEQLRLSIDRLLRTLRRLESELANYIVDHTFMVATTATTCSVTFEAEFVLNLTFVLFEQVLLMLDDETTHHHKQQYRQTNEQLVFELDNDADVDDDVDCAFETRLDELMNNWILVYLPSIINKVMRQDKVNNFGLGNGQSIIDFFRFLFKSNTFSVASLRLGNKKKNKEFSLLHDILSGYYDVESDLHSPHCTSERVEFNAANAISKRFSTLADNLVKLNYYTCDPLVGGSDAITGYSSDAAYMDTGVEESTTTFANLLASYYTMGAFDLRTLLFDNTCQMLHEAKSLECARIFDQPFCNGGGDDEFLFDDLRLVESPNPDKAMNKQSSMWSYLEQVDLDDVSMNEEKSPTLIDEDMPSIIEDIMNRISNMIKLADDCNSASKSTSSPPSYRQCTESKYEHNHEKPTQSSRSWTVAPKMFALSNQHHNHHHHQQSAIDMSINNVCGHISTTSVISDKRGWQAQSNHLRPIGTRPTSMLLSRGGSGGGGSGNSSSSYRHAKFANVSQTSTAASAAKKKPTKQAGCGFVCDLTWRMNNSPNATTETAVSPFVVYETSTTLTDGSFNLNEIIDLKKMRPELLHASSATVFSSSSSSSSSSRAATATMPINIPPAQPVKTRKYSVAPFFMLEHHYSQNYEQYQPEPQPQPQPPPYQNSTNNIYYYNRSSYQSNVVYQQHQQQQQQQQQQSRYHKSTISSYGQSSPLQSWLHHQSPSYNHIPTELSIDQAIVSVSTSQPIRIRMCDQQNYSSNQTVYYTHKNGLNNQQANINYGKQPSLEETIACTYKYSSNINNKNNNATTKKTTNDYMPPDCNTRHHQTNHQKSNNNQYLNKQQHGGQANVDSSSSSRYEKTNAHSRSSKNATSSKKQSSSSSSKWTNNRY